MLLEQIVCDSPADYLSVMTRKMLKIFPQHLRLPTTQFRQAVVVVRAE